MRALSSFVPLVTVFTAPRSQQHHTATRTKGTGSGSVGVNRYRLFSSSGHSDAASSSGLPRGSTVHLRDILSTKRLNDDDNVRSSSTPTSERESQAGGKRMGSLHRLDRLQAVADLAMEGADEDWGCADIGTDHGLLAICLHANGARVIAGDRAAGPLSIARENVRLYLRKSASLKGAHAAERAASTPAAGAFAGTAIRSARPLWEENNDFTFRQDEGEYEEDGMEEGREVSARASSRLECRLGDGLDVLETGEVGTVCIAGVGVKTMIRILSGRNDSEKAMVDETKDIPDLHSRGATDNEDSALSALGIGRLVLQPMDARLEYVRDLRVWLRNNGWRITQETIISTPGKGGKHAFLTLRAESPESITQDQSDANRTPAERVLSTVSWPAGVGQEEMSHWLGDFLPRHATDTEWVREGLGPNRAEEARTYLAYLRHQSDWLRAIERSRPSLPRQDGDGLGERQKGGVGNASIALVVDSLVGAVEEALRAATGELESKEDFEGTRLLATARRWRRR